MEIGGVAERYEKVIHGGDDCNTWVVWQTRGMTVRINW